MSTDFEREPLDISEFPSNLQKHVESGAPEKMQLMAAQGMVPAPPGETIRLLYQLHFDSSERIAEEIESSLRELPENVVVGSAEEEQHAGVLDWLAEHRADSVRLVEQLLRNDAVDDRTVCRIARDADADVCDMIATNEVRVLRTPAIIEELYQNPAARMATVDQLIELAQRNDVELANLPGVQRAIKSKDDIFSRDQRDTTGEIEEDSFAELLEGEAEQAEREEEKLEELEDESLTRSEREKIREEFEERIEGDGARDGPVTPGELQSMSIAQKIRLATVGSRSVIKRLVQDANRLVHMAAIESPRIKMPDAERFASQKSLPEGVISYIANNREWTQNYQVVKNLVNNPKTPVADSLDLIKRLRNNDLKRLQRNRDVPHQVSRAAERLHRKRTGGGGRGGRA